jgi:hypothetical protein
MAHQSDWQKYQSALSDWQASGGAGKPPQIVRDFRRAQGLARDAELRAKGWGPSQLKTVNAQIDKQLVGFEKDRQKAVNKAIADKAPRHARLIANVDSDCFESVTWKDGVLTCTFWRGGDLVYQYVDVNRDDFIDMASGSMGSWFNQNLR